MAGKELTARERGQLGPVAQADNDNRVYRYVSCLDAKMAAASILDILDW